MLETAFATNFLIEFAKQPGLGPLTDAIYRLFSNRLLLTTQKPLNLKIKHSINQYKKNKKIITFNYSNIRLFQYIR